MSERYYPSLNADAVAAIKLIARQVAEDPAYLLVGECPYDDDLRRILQPSSAKSGGTRRTGGAVQPVVDLETEAVSLYKDLKSASTQLGDADSAERMSYFRTATSLLERLITMQERAGNLKRRSQFEETVLSVLDEMVPADKRTEFRDRIAEFAKEQS